MASNGGPNNSAALFGDDSDAANAAARSISETAKNPRNAKLGSLVNNSWNDARGMANPDKEARPPPVIDRQKNTGIGVLIDTENLLSKEPGRVANPYYIVYKGKRFYGSSPEDVLTSLKEQVAANPSIVNASERKPGVMRSMFSSASKKYNNWKTRRADKKAANAAARAKCPFLKGDKVLVKIANANIDSEEGAYNGMTGTVQSYVPGEAGRVCPKVVVKFPDSKILTFSPNMLRMYNMRRRFSLLGKSTKAGLGKAGQLTTRGARYLRSKGAQGARYLGSKGAQGARAFGSAASSGLGAAGRSISSAAASARQKYLNRKTRRGPRPGSVANVAAAKKPTASGPNNNNSAALFGDNSAAANAAARRLSAAAKKPQGATE